MKKTIIAIALGSLLTSITQAGVLSINLTNKDGPRQVTPRDSTGIVKSDKWHNITASTKNVAGSGIDITLGGKIDGSTTESDDTSRPDKTNGFLALYEAGLRDKTPNKKGDTFIKISNMKAYLKAKRARSYNIYVYYKGGTNTDKDKISLGMDSSKLKKIDPAKGNTSAKDHFVRKGRANSNYIIYKRLKADSTTIFINKEDRDGILAGIQIETTP